MVIALVVSGRAGLRVVLEVRRRRAGRQPGPARPTRRSTRRLYNLVEGLTHRQRPAQAAHLHRRRPGAERLRHRPQPPPRRHRRHHRPAREDEPGRARGRARPRAAATSRTTTSSSRPSPSRMVGAVALLSDIAHPHDVVERRPGAARRRPQRRRQPVLAIFGFVLLDPRAAASPRLMQVAVSRRRESLADVSAVEMTRYPPGLISALEKLQRRHDGRPLGVARPPPTSGSSSRWPGVGDEGKLGSHQPPVRHPPAARGAHRRAPGALRYR